MRLRAVSVDNFTAYFFVLRHISVTFEPYLNHGGSSMRDVRPSWTRLHRFTYIYTKWPYQYLKVPCGGSENRVPEANGILRGIFMQWSLWVQLYAATAEESSSGSSEDRCIAAKDAGRKRRTRRRGLPGGLPGNLSFKKKSPAPASLLRELGMSMLITDNLQEPHSLRQDLSQ